MVKYENGKFRILDNSSKFGTLVKLPEAIEVQKDKLGIQCGRTLITVSVKTSNPQPKDFDMMSDTLNVSDKETSEMIPEIVLKNRQSPTSAGKGVAASEMIPEIVLKKSKSPISLVSAGKRAAAEVKPASRESKEVRDAESVGTLDVEEVSPVHLKVINRRSKKINKAPKSRKN